MLGVSHHPDIKFQDGCLAKDILIYSLLVYLYIYTHNTVQLLFVDLLLKCKHKIQHNTL